MVETDWQAKLLVTMDACATRHKWELRHRLCDIRDYLAGIFDGDPKWIASRKDQMIETVQGLRDSQDKEELMKILLNRLGDSCTNAD